MAGNLLLAAVQAGGYVNIYKGVALLVVLLLWARMLTWADKDADAAHLPRINLNVSNLGGMALAYALVFLLSVNFILALLMVLAVFGIEAGVYLTLRQKTVGLGDLKAQFLAWLQSFKREKTEALAAGTVQLTGKQGAIMTPPPKESPDRPTYDAVQKALADPLHKSADQIDLAPVQTGIGVRYTVDGFPYEGPTIDGTSGAAAIMLLKVIAGLSMEEKRKPQTGSLTALYSGQKKELKLQTAGTTAGEFMRVIVDPAKRNAFAFDQLGFTEAQLATMKKSIKEMGGIILLAAPKGQGLTSLLYGVIRGHDSFLSHMHTVERAPETDLEGITQNKLEASASAADEAKIVSWVTSQEPDVLTIDKVEDPRAAADLIRFASQEGKRVYVGVRASTAADAIDQWRKAVGDTDKALSQLKMVVVGRVVRKLCSACKVGYTPDPGTLKKLNMSPEKVTQLFQARDQPLRDPKGRPIPCEFCKDLHFKGRTGVFEVVTVDDTLRDALKQDISAGGKAGTLYKTVFRKQRGRYLQEEALALVENGETSVPEVLRVMRGGDATPASRKPVDPAAAGAAPAAAPPRAPVRKTTA